MSNFSYFIREGISNLFSNKVVTITTLLTVIVSLLITGVFQMVSINFVNISKELGDKFEFNVFIKDTVLDENLPLEKEKILHVSLVKDAELKTKNQTLEEVQSKLGDTAVLKGLSTENNPFRNCYKVTITDLSQAETVIENIKKIESVDSVSNNVDASKEIAMITTKVRIYSLIAYLLLAALCLIIITNIINVSIFGRRKHINIMKYVGATNGFVKFPFIIEGILIGIIGASISIVILVYSYTFLYGQFNQVANGIYLLKPKDVFINISIINLSYGVLIGAIGASFAVNKHLKV